MHINMVKQMYIVLILLATMINLSSNWRTDRRPRIFGEKVPNRILSPTLKRVQRRLVILHDYFRSKVTPTASNMLSMKWHKGAARTAQRWSEQCRFLTHDSPRGRWVDNFGSCGQNIFVSTHKVPWMFVLKSWYIEKENFTYGSDRNNLKDIGHYTQMVWAASHKVGCGLAKCSHGPFGKPYYNYVCNYCPVGNYNDRIGFPYKAGRQCGSCPGSCRSREVRLCTNACHTTDLWSNCGDLHRRWAGWLCNTATPDGFERRKKCGATCTCRGKIHD